MKNISIFHPATILSTFLWVGKIPFAPGSFGSLAAYPFTFLLINIANKLNHLLAKQSIVIPTLAITTILLIILFLIGIWSSNVYVSKTNSTDPGEIVIDEVVGQAIVIIALLPVISEFNTIKQRAIVIISSFLLFRFFDIKKPWPINWFDQNIKGGLGVMLDDIIASVMAIIVFYVILFKLIDFQWVHL